jgi:hypothetical protein
MQFEGAIPILLLIFFRTVKPHGEMKVICAIPHSGIFNQKYKNTPNSYRKMALKAPLIYQGDESAVAGCDPKIVDPR